MRTAGLFDGSLKPLNPPCDLVSRLIAVAPVQTSLVGYTLPASSWSQSVAVICQPRLEPSSKNRSFACIAAGNPVAVAVAMPRELFDQVDKLAKLPQPTSIVRGQIVQLAANKLGQATVDQDT